MKRRNKKQPEEHKDKFPFCYQHKSISRRQDKKGNFHCDLLKENTEIIRCEDCEHKYEMMRKKEVKKQVEKK